MRKETTPKRKRVTKATRQKQQLIMIGGGAMVLILIVILAIFVFGSCGNDYAKAETNTVYVLESGKVISTDVESFDEKVYDKGELKTYIKDAINTYNKENGNNSLKQKSFKVKDDKATLVLEYATADVYEAVNGVELFTGTVAEAKKAGYTFEGSFAKIVDDKAIVATADEFMDGDDYKVVIIKSNTKVVIPGDVCFVSTENVSKVDGDSVKIKDGSQLFAEEVTVDTEFGTEAEGSDGSISEDELDAEGEIIFDFGGEEKEESQYSEVLTYIIYK